MESRIPTIERMMPWTRVIAVEMLKMVRVCITLKDRANGIF